MHWLTQTLHICIFIIIMTSQDKMANAWNVTCPAKCLCELRPSSYYKTDLHTVDCGNSKLRSLPKNIPQETEVLQLSRNSIAHASLEKEDIRKLRELDMDYNEIQSLDSISNSFTNFSSLEYLKLSNNHLTSLSNDILSGLRDLRELVLSNNDISEIEDDAFRYLPNLQMLNLEGNLISHINNTWFDNINSLKILNFADNNVTSLGSKAFGTISTLNQLDLSGNRIYQVHNLAFQGVPSVQTLNLENNKLTYIPGKAFIPFKGLKILNLNNNPVSAITFDSLCNIHVRSISLSSMPVLETVDSRAFHDLPSLVGLEMHSNPRLTYIDPQALSNLPLLTQLNVHSNNLQSLSASMVTKLSGLRIISFYDNPVNCDCNVHWIKERLERHNISSNNSNMSFPRGEEIVCSLPVSLGGQLLRNVPLTHIADQCQPTILTAFFNDSYQLELGQTAIYRCRAIGVPTPHVHWILASGKTVNNTSNHSRVRLSHKGTLTLLHVKAADAGTYTCVATSDAGVQTRSTLLQVHNSDIHILHRGVATNFITVTWNGTDSTVLTSDYVILYRKSGSADLYGRIHLRPYMRTYTITNLQPQTSYEFCMAYQHNVETVKLNCQDIRTKHAMYARKGIHTLGSLSILVSLCATTSVILLLCFGIMIFRRYTRRKSYEEPNGASFVLDTPTTRKQLSHMSQIPLDNLYNPPSTHLSTPLSTPYSTPYSTPLSTPMSTPTPLCTSRTSLISQSRA